MTVRMLASRLVPQFRRRGIQIDRLPAALIEHPEINLLEITLEHLVAYHLALHPDPDFFFLQIGAFDGNDAVHAIAIRHDLTGIAVEPQPEQFAALQATYADQPRVDLRNVAVADRDEVRNLYRIRPGMPAWTQELASFDRDTILKHDRPGRHLRENIISTPVQCVTYATLLSTGHRCDLLHIDAEGLDGRLLRMFDFERWRPSIVQFEHRHLSYKEHEESVRLLTARGYRAALSEGDTLAYLAIAES